LAVELVAREAEDDELVRVCSLDLFVEGFEPGKLWREAAFGGGVYGEDYLAGVLGERVGFALFVFGGEVEEGGSGGHGAVLLVDSGGARCTAAEAEEGLRLCYTACCWLSLSFQGCLEDGAGSLHI